LQLVAAARELKIKEQLLSTERNDQAAVVTDYCCTAVKPGKRLDAAEHRKGKDHRERQAVVLDEQ
jgi:hypothetical protein